MSKRTRCRPGCCNPTKERRRRQERLRRPRTLVWCLQRPAILQAIQERFVANLNRSSAFMEMLCESAEGAITVTTTLGETVRAKHIDAIIVDDPMADDGRDPTERKAVLVRLYDEPLVTARLIGDKPE